MSEIFLVCYTFVLTTDYEPDVKGVLTVYNPTGLFNESLHKIGLQLQLITSFKCPLKKSLYLPYFSNSLEKWPNR